MEEKDKDLTIATFRFGIIADFVTGVHLSYGEKEKLFIEKTTRKYSIPDSYKTFIARSTIKKWINDYKKAGNRIEGLFPRSRKDKGYFRALDPAIQLAIKDLKREKPSFNGVDIIKELKHRKIIGINDKFNQSIFYRFLEKEKLNGAPPKEATDRRSFEAEKPNEMWQSDVLHGPQVIEKGRQKKAYLIAIIDDHSRLIIHGEFYFSEKLKAFKDCLQKGIEKRGLPRKIYIDNGSCFKALNVEQIAACLGIAIKHTPPYKPEGRGKIERFFRTTRDQFLRHLPAKLTLEDLNERLDNWLEEYHNRIHNSTGQTPLKRYQLNMSCVRPAPKDILKYFRFVEFRRVKKDRTFRLNGITFEAPVNLIDKQVELRFHKESPTEVEVFFDGKSFGQASVLNTHVNFKIGREYKKRDCIKEDKSNELISLATNEDEINKSTTTIKDGELFSRMEEN